MDSINDSSSSDLVDEAWLMTESQKLLRSPNHQFESKNGYFVLLFKPTSYIENNERFEKKIQITRDEYDLIKGFLADNPLHELSNNQPNTANEESVPIVRPRIGSTQQSLSNNQSNIANTANKESVPNV